MLLLFPLPTFWYDVIALKACGIISPPGEEEKLSLTALLCHQKGRRKYREQHFFFFFFGEISLSLTPNAGEWQNKERDIVCTETLQKIICWEQREQVPCSSQTGNVVTHIHQLLQSELTLKPAGEKAYLGTCFPLSNSSSPGCRALLSPGALLGCGFGCGWLLWKAQTVQKETLLSAKSHFLLNICSTVQRDQKTHTRTDCHFQKNLHSAELGLWCFGFHFL